MGKRYDWIGRNYNIRVIDNRYKTPIKIGDKIIEYLRGFDGVVDVIWINHKKNILDGWDGLIVVKSNDKYSEDNYNAIMFSCNHVYLCIKNNFEVFNSNKYPNKAWIELVTDNINGLLEEMFQGVNNN